MEDEPETFWLYCKNLSSGSREYVASTSLWEISPVNNSEWKRVPFASTSADEFLLRKEREKKLNIKTDYALLEGDYLYRYYIMDAADTKEALKKRVHEKKGRGKAPPRLSASDSKVHKKFFMQYEERMDAEKNCSPPKKKTKVDPKRQKAVGSDIIQRFHRKEVSGGTSVFQTTPQLIDLPETSSAGNNSCTAPVRESSASPVPCLTVCKESQTDITSEQMNMQTMELETAKKQILDLEKRIKDNDILQQIASQTKTISEKISKSSLPARECKLKHLRFAVEVEDEFKADFKPCDSMTYVGRRISVKTEALMDIELNHCLLSKRGEAVFELITGDSIANYSLTRRGLIGKSGLKLIPEVVVSATKKILQEMDWGEIPPSSKSISLFFTKQPGEARRRKVDGQDDGKEDKESKGRKNTKQVEVKESEDDKDEEDKTEEENKEDKTEEEKKEDGDAGIKKDSPKILNAILNESVESVGKFSADSDTD